MFDPYQTDALRVSDPHETTVFRLRDTLNTYVSPWEKVPEGRMRGCFVPAIGLSEPEVGVETGKDPHPPLRGTFSQGESTCLAPC